MRPLILKSLNAVVADNFITNIADQRLLLENHAAHDTLEGNVLA
jgi:hypothetical protein